MAEYTHYFQIEAVNIYPAVYDTSQLSVVRGGSLLLKAAVEALAGNPHLRAHIEEYNKGKDRPPFLLPPEELTRRLTAISTGASSGIFGYTGNDAAGVAREISKYLSGHEYLRDFTFTVVFEPYRDSFPEVKERLIAKARLQQLRQLGAAPTRPEPAQPAFSAEPCALQGILPAYSIMEHPPKSDDGRYKTRKISPSCQNRFLFGRHFRNALYRAEIAEIDPPSAEILRQLENTGTTESFDEIADTNKYLNLENKIAVLYLDGNGFGGIQRQLVHSVADQEDFDAKVKGYRRQFLADLVQRWITYVQDNRMPLETLLWGGDEMIFVVPASRGFELVQFFYEKSRDWNIEGKNKEGECETRRLTHAGGLVFCQYKTPIGRIVELAKDLAESVKQRAYGRKDNFFDYAVLESIDYPAEGLSEFFDQRYGPQLGPLRFPLQPLSGSDWPAADEDIAATLKLLPKGQAYEIARAALAGDHGPEVEKMEREEQDTPEASEEPLTNAGQPSESASNSVFLKRLRRFKHLQALEENGALPGLMKRFWKDLLRPPPDTDSADKPQPAAVARWQWLHLVELWDYLERAEKESGAEDDAHA